MFNSMQEGFNKFKSENYNYKYNNSINISNNAENYKKKADKIDTFKNVNTSGPNGTIYKKQKAVKKVPLQKTITKGKFDTKLLDSYDVNYEIGSGGFSKVYEVRNKASDTIRACKYIDKKNLKKF